MDKNEAIHRANTACQLNRQNTHFANINATGDVWWLEIPVARVSVGGADYINLLLFDGRSDELHRFRIPTEYLRANMTHLDIRDEERIALELATEGKRFQNVRPADSGVEFAQFRVCTI